MSSTQQVTRPFLGVGWKFPLQVTPGGKIARAFFEQRVEESIYLILSTAKGERMMLPDFGCGIHDLVFGINDPRTRSAVVQQVREADVQQRFAVVRGVGRGTQRGLGDLEIEGPARAEAVEPQARGEQDDDERRRPRARESAALA